MGASEAPSLGRLAWYFYGGLILPNVYSFKLSVYKKIVPCVAEPPFQNPGSATVRRSCPIDFLRHVFKRRRVENDRSHSTGMTRRSLGLHGFPSSTYTQSKLKHTKMKGHAYKIWGGYSRSSPCHATPEAHSARSKTFPDSGRQIHI